LSAVDFQISKARYAKDKFLVQPTRRDDHLKTRTARLLGAMNCRWTNRERGYICSAVQVAKLEKYLADGWDASIMGELEPPKSKQTGLSAEQMERWGKTGKWK
jgi:hypothetical protein